MASITDIQSMFTAVLQQQSAQQAQQLQAKLASRDKVIAQLMNKIQLREATPAPDSPPHIPQTQSTSKKSSPNRLPANKNKATTSKGAPSNAPTRFFRRVDAAILESDKLEGKRTQRRRRIIPSTPQESLFLMPPIGQPLDFYEPEWFNDLSYHQQIYAANTCEVVFSPDASQSLMGTTLASEKLSDQKVTKQFFNCLSKPYNLTEHEGDDTDNTNVEDDNSYSGEGINLADTPGEDDNECKEIEGEEVSEFLDDFADDTMYSSNHKGDNHNEDDDNGLESLSVRSGILL
ncbi:hypothetical protein H4Q26_002450 [Puccinia striiformis f. sp. tritici PST-130]|nr:hypothetical protein H4Q26_002450 [Puccinia striiformis f. sp. tritici PST-130]